MTAVLVLGGGVAGLQAANDLAGLGFHVYLVERSPSLGGRMAQLDKTFPTNDCSMCILAPKMIECASHPNITLLTCSELENLTGELGRFSAVVRKRTRYIDEKKCTGCGDCANACPVELPGEFEMKLAARKAVYKPFPQAVPNVFAITRLGTSPCKDGCPAHIGVQAYTQLIKLGKFDEALSVVHETTPFAGSLGRICPQPCRDACMRAEAGEAIAIAALKRAAAEFGSHTPTITADEDQRQQRQQKPIAVIGAGPGGLTAAYNLARKGYPVTVFEKLPEPGGMLLTGVPDYRLPRQVLAEEINLVRGLGVTIETSSPIEGAGGIQDLFKKGFNAIFIATGAHRSIALGIPGEDLDGVAPAVEFLRQVGLGGRIMFSSNVVVIGGGNAAIDAARTLLRLGARQATLLYRRTAAEMPAYQNEIDAAVNEGVVIRYLVAPTRIIGDEGQVTGIEAIRMRLGEPDGSGRRRPVPIAGSEFHIECNMVIPAIGQQPERDFPGPQSPLETAPNGLIAANPETGATNLDGVFAGGDAVTGPATAIEAIAAANRAAEAIHHYLETGNAKINETSAPPVARPEPAELEKLEKTPRVQRRELPTPHRRYSFAEVEFGYDLESAAQEAQRCLNCAGCSDCQECVRVCQAHAVDHHLEDEILNLQVGAVVVATGFDAMDTSILEEYGAHRLANVVTGMQFERLLSASGPTGGHVLRPSDRRAPKTIAFIQCVGSRDMRHHVYCSSVCCMHATKEAILANEHDRETRSTIFYTDLRAAGKTFQEYVARARDEYHVSYIRSRPAFLEEDEETRDVRVIYEDTATRQRKSENFDMAVLCQALVPSGGSAIAGTLGVELNDLGFIRIPDPLTAPVDTSRGGVLAVGFASAPQDIPDSVVQASAAAGRAAELLEDNTDE